MEGIKMRINLFKKLSDPDENQKKLNQSNLILASINSNMIIAYISKMKSFTEVREHVKSIIETTNFMELSKINMVKFEDFFNIHYSEE